MTLSLARYLVEGSLVSSSQMDDALQHNVVFGGGLDTSLLELGLIGETAMAKALSALLEIPPAAPDLLAQRDPRTVKLLPARMAAEYSVLPVVMRGRSLIAIAGPMAYPDTADELGFLLSLKIQLFLVCEFRFQGLLQDWLGMEIEPRYQFLLERLGRPYRSPTVTASSRSPELPIEAQAAQEALTTRTVASGEQQEPVETESDLEQLRTGLIRMEDALTACMEADHRDDIVAITLRFARQFMPFVGWFAVQNDMIFGWEAVGSQEAGSRIKKYSSPIHQPSVLNTVVQTQAPYLGSVPWSVEGNKELLLTLGRPEPQNALVLPIVLGNRMVGILFGDARSRIIRGDRVSELMQFVNCLSEAFEKLILRKKAEARGADA